MKFGGRLLITGFASDEERLREEEEVFLEFCFCLIHASHVPVSNCVLAPDPANRKPPRRLVKPCVLALAIEFMVLSFAVTVE